MQYGDPRIIYCCAAIKHLIGPKGAMPRRISVATETRVSFWTQGLVKIVIHQINAAK